MSHIVHFYFVLRPHCERYIQQALRRHHPQQVRCTVPRNHALFKSSSSSQQSIFLISERGLWRLHHAHKNRSSRYLLSARGHLLVLGNQRNVVTWTRITKALMRPRNIIITGLVGTGALISQVLHFYGWFLKFLFPVEIKPTVLFVKQVVQFYFHFRDAFVELTSNDQIVGFTQCCFACFVVHVCGKCLYM